MKTQINSEIGKLEGVIIHPPGSELENMTPENAERALYSDILNLSIASKEFNQLAGVLNKITSVYEVKILLERILQDEKIKLELLKEICNNEGISDIEEELAQNTSSDLSNLIVEGIVLEKNNLTNYLCNERFLMRPLHNMFFTRDSAMGMNDKMLIGRMANPIRDRESLIMEFIFKYHPLFETETLNPAKPINTITKSLKSTLEGGDFQVARDDIFVIGTGVRTSTQGIDFIIENIKHSKTEPHHIIVQELPSKPESFIHLDMVFTLLNNNECMVYEPLILKMSRYRTIHIQIENKRVTKIEEVPDILSALKSLGMELKPVYCGGENDLWVQEREQWHSGANFLAFAPGKVIGYARNVYTMEALSKNGYQVLKASAVINDEISPSDYEKCIITIAGAELARGGGGARCMTMPFKRAEVDW